MDKILRLVKCEICHEILKSPVNLPCNDTVCKKHVSDQTKDGFFRCGKCGVEHQVPTNGFQSVPFLEELIKTGIANFDYGTVHNKAKKSCESFEELLEEIEVILKDPLVHSHEKISELRNSVQLKGEELKLIIDQEMKNFIDRLDEYERQSKEYLSSNEFKVESEKLETELKSAHSNLNSWLASLNKLKFDQEKWENIIEESSQQLKSINNEFDTFKNKLLLNKYGQNQRHVNWFKSIKVFLNLEYISINKNSRIINEILGPKLEELLKNKYLNGKKWSLLYQGSRDGFEASNFHSRCDGFPNTLTIVKSSNGSIFGGYTRVPWESIEYDVQNGYKYDQNAFLFSLVNDENSPVIFEHTNLSRNINENYARGSVWSSTSHGPIFGAGHDLFICDCSNTIAKSYSNLGYIYTHPEFPKGSDRIKDILAGSRYFKVDEIEVFQIQE